MSTVWLFKSCEESNSQYISILTASGFSPVHVPVLSFQFCNQVPLKNALQIPQNHSGIIFTSQRAVEAVAEIYSTLSVSCHHTWSEKKIFVIGEATGSAVQKLLKLSYTGQESGNAQQLAPIIIKETEAFDKPLLYPCGNLGRDELPKLLVKHDRDFRALTVYETSQHPQLKSVIQKLISTGQLPTYMVFFSPSGVNFTLSILKSLSVDITGVKMVAIGPTTNTALVQQNIPVSGICPSPTPEGLLHVLKSPL
ncbi:uroporphyrinogen-III synthase-like [Homarus americanus]|uniref:Uroporphyrinogen-III synthase n=1 Tax=Homarus americanus TaxID=6706 RepID=A0A8J5N5J1_HOMAM|nr:uroporphyrinogen-III synthase-like [Homarus americanus]KAG7173856.1 Uroporphyrinogen-III synthase-like [Homarus americanus]